MIVGLYTFVEKYHPQMILVEILIFFYFLIK